MLQQLSQRVYVVGGGSNKGLIAGPKGLIAVDTGLDDSHARRLLKAAEELGRPLTAVLTTHAHADHFGGHAWLARRTGCRIYAPAGEDAVLRHPVLEPFSLYGGALPPAGLRGKFLLAPPCPVHEVVQPGPLEVEGIRIEAVPLPGHSLGQMGYRVDEVFFVGDALFPSEALQKYYAPYCVDLDETLRSLEHLAGSRAATYVPGHGPLFCDSESLAAAVAAHRQRLEELRSRVLACLSAPLTADQVLAAVLAEAGEHLPDAAGFVLARAPILACLTSLHRAGLVEERVEENAWRWARKMTPAG
ncbi:MAG: MBL fold metallo-hydrolase [Bacillota bacterium]|nr:MBL fold metallo-hydrolase [Bacillota bacterium]